MSKQRKQSSMVKWLMRHSKGLVRSELQAEVILLFISVFNFWVSYYIWTHPLSLSAFF